MSSHRHAENVLSKVSQKVDIACGQFVLYPYGDGAPQRHAIGCHCVLSLCHLMYCHLPNISLCRLRKFTKSQSHLQQIPPISFIMPQLCAHGAFKITNHLSPRLFFHSLCIRSSLHSIPLSSPPPAVSRAPGPLLLAASTAAPAARSRSTAAVRPSSAARCSGVEHQAPKGLETSTAGSTPWVSTAHPHCSGRNCNLWSEVPEFYLFQNCIASWLNGSHYLLLLFVKIT